MFFPPQRKTATSTYTADILINENGFFPYCDEFKYLGTVCNPSLKDDLDIQQQINQACCAIAAMKHVLCNKNKL